MRMNISVPDTLAEEVRRRDVPISAVCQRALRDEVARLKAMDDATDILVYVESEQADPDPTTWPGFDAGMPHLIYGRHPAHGLGWALYYERGAEAGDNPDDHFIGGGGPDDVEWALSNARSWLSLVATEDMEEIKVEVGEPVLTVGFTGRWLVEPDSDETRSGEAGQDAGAYWGVALTKRGRIAVFVAHCNGRWPPSLRDYDSLDQAANNGAPADIVAMAAAELGEERVLWRDI